MAYSIGYGVQRQELQYHRTSRLGLLVAGFFVLFLIGVQLFWAEGAAVLRQIVFPFHAQTAASMECMVNSIMEGSSIPDAVTAFCREVIESASLP